MTWVPALLADIALKTSLVCLAGALAAGLAKRRSASARHDVWAAVLACSILLPCAALAVRWLGSVPQAAPVHASLMAVASRLPPGAPPGAIETLDRIWSGDGGGSWSGPWLGASLGALWLAGAMLTAVRIAFSWTAARRLVRSAAPFRLSGAAGGPPLLLSAEIETPAAFGFTRPVILLPRDAPDWAPERLRAAIAHERTHVARGDCAIELLVQAACALHWFNPLVWAAARALRTERELACDEKVLAEGLDPTCYAETLLEAARRARGQPAETFVAMVRISGLERRIVALLRPRRRAGSAGPRAAALTLLVLATVAAGALTLPASGLLAAGSVQLSALPLSGLDDPMSELVPLDYPALAATAAAIPAKGRDAAAIHMLKSQLSRRPNGYGDLVRERAIWALAQAQDGRLFEPIAANLSDPDWRIRAYAAWGLEATGDRRATALLIPLLDDPVWRVRAMAGAALARFGDPAAGEAMAASLSDPAWQVRMSAIDYAEQRSEPAFSRRLAPLLSDPHWGTRERARALLDR